MAWRRSHLGRRHWFVQSAAESLRPETGARSLAGAWAGVTDEEPLFGLLTDLATSLDMIPFRLSTRSNRSITRLLRRFNKSCRSGSGCISSESARFLEAVAPLTRTAVAMSSHRVPSGSHRSIARGDGRLSRVSWRRSPGPIRIVAAIPPDAEATAIPRANPSRRTSVNRPVLARACSTDVDLRRQKLGSRLAWGVWSGVPSSPQRARTTHTHHFLIWNSFALKEQETGI